MGSEVLAGSCTGLARLETVLLENKIIQEDGDDVRNSFNPWLGPHRRDRGWTGESWVASLVRQQPATGSHQPRSQSRPLPPGLPPLPPRQRLLHLPPPQPGGAVQEAQDKGEIWSLGPSDRRYHGYWQGVLPGPRPGWPQHHPGQQEQAGAG